MARPPFRWLFCAPGGVTFRCRHSATKSLVSYPLSAPHGDAPRVWNLLQHDQRRLTLRRAVGLKHLCVHDQSVAVLCEQMAVVAQLRFLATALASQPCIRVSRGLVRLVATTLPVEVHRRMARIVRGRSVLLILALKALQARPCFDPRSIHCEVLVTVQALRLRLRDHLA